MDTTSDQLQSIVEACNSEEIYKWLFKEESFLSLSSSHQMARLRGPLILRMRNSMEEISLIGSIKIIQAFSTQPLHKVTRKGGALGIVEIITTPDRVLPYCEKIDTSPGRYGFMVLILDEENTVGGGSGMMSSLKGCKDWEAGVRKVLSKGKRIRLVGTGRYDEPRVKERFAYTFPGLFWHV